MPASDLKQALNILDPELELKTPEDLDKYFVEREMSPIEEMRILLQETKGHHRLLFTGHRGSGKSTELSKLAQRLGDAFLVIDYSVKDVLSINDLDAGDVLISMVLQLIERATALEEDGSGPRFPLDTKVREHLRVLFERLASDAEVTTKKGKELSGELSASVAKLTARIGKEDEIRYRVRQWANSHVTDIMEHIAIVVAEIGARAKRRVLVVVEDLDKTNLAQAKTLFYEHANTLLAPPVSVIYTFPTAMRHDNSFMQVKNSFSQMHIFPNIKTRSKDGEQEQKGIDLLAAILTQRVTPELFDSGTLDALAEMSGGVPRELIVLARRACVDAMRREADKIDMAAVETAVSHNRMDYEVLLTSEQLKRLREIKASKRVENEPEDRELLHNLSVLEYRSRGIWYDVNPLIEPLLETE